MKIDHDLAFVTKAVSRQFLSTQLGVAATRGDPLLNRKNKLTSEHEAEAILQYSLKC